MDRLAARCPYQILNGAENHGGKEANTGRKMTINYDDDIMGRDDSLIAKGVLSGWVSK